MNISEKLIQLRKSKGMSQEEVAEKLDVSRQAISRWETGTALPDANNILVLSELYNVSADYLLKDDYISDEVLTKVKQTNTILHNNLTWLAIIAHVSFLNVAAQPWDGIGEDDSFAIAIKLIPLLLASIWMASNHRYETNKMQRVKNTKIEMYYCICQAAISVVGYMNHWTLLTTVLLLAVALFYVFVVNPKYMNRKLAHKKK